jgi:hypothetical protein
MVPEVRIGILRLSSIGKSKKYQICRSPVIDSTKDTLDSLAFRAAPYFWKQTTSGVNANRPCVIAASCWGRKLDTCDVLVRDRCENNCTGNRPLAARPSLLNQGPGSSFRDSHDPANRSSVFLALTSPRHVPPCTYAPRSPEPQSHNVLSACSRLRQRPHRPQNPSWHAAGHPNTRGIPLGPCRPCVKICYAISIFPSRVYQ